MKLVNEVKDLTKNVYKIGAGLSSRATDWRIANSMLFLTILVFYEASFSILGLSAKVEVYIASSCRSTHDSAPGLFMHPKQMDLLA